MQVQTSQTVMRVKPRLKPKSKLKPKRRRLRAILEPMPPEPPVKPPKKVATYADLLKVPDHKVAEILDGELHVSPRPALPHAFAASRLGMVLGPPFAEGRGGPGGWHILDEPELHLGPDVLVPDLGGWRRERLPVVPNAASLSIAPDWVCEVLSPSTRRIDVLKKRRIYGREGVAHLWLIDPIDHILEVFRLQFEQCTLVGTFGDEEVVYPEPFEALPLELSRLWSSPLEQDAQVASEETPTAE